MKWIPVTEEPEEVGTYFVRLMGGTNRYVYDVWFYSKNWGKGHWSDVNTDEVVRMTHWMKIEEPDEQS